MKNEVDKNKLIRKIKEFVVFHCEHLFGTSGQETHHTTAHHSTPHHTAYTPHKQLTAGVFSIEICNIIMSNQQSINSDIFYYIARFQLKSNQFKSNQINH